MSAQLRKAMNELNTVSLLMAELINKSKFISSPFLQNSVSSLVSSINGDKAIQAFLSKSRESGYEALLGELSILVNTRAKSYQGALRKLIRDVDLMKAQATNTQATGMGWSLFEPSSWFSSSSSDRELGLSLLRSYFNTSKAYSSFNYASFEDFLSWAESRVENFATNVGELVRMNVYSTSESEAENRLKDLANKSKGLASLSQIIAAAGGSGSTVNWSAVLPDVAAETGQGVITQASEVLQSAGTGVLGTLNLIKYLPWFVVGGGLIYLAIIASKHSAVVERIGRGKKA